MSTCGAASRQTSMLGEAVTYFLTRHFSRVSVGVNMLKNDVLAGTYRPISFQDAIKRRFKCVSAVHCPDHGFTSPTRTCMASRYGDTSAAIESNRC